ncbi:Archaea-specific RecJ-like exonuclease, containsDnaJ-type Zn finger domain [Halalkaliarchaeum sp. AArc-CO]|uniref:DHH family phosphoesterase n=1 Tax=unclassified Halalkaliarchaeum TaxID=2678344 RepID=UPI00217E2766|nr:MULTISPECIES: OB-fold nucleic acid binding domain-containing protein [unclassified Halalkaliarchaeum]MDR5672929.1 OB-fold nucleic acid binding domain-containing protein [Halalkaliarchaeum sp. AArc-GB]UWG50278.1 Archaea-specific RecJ-like exonuclease, containsDnaJ-type Zn finger domain [Halalkaliarchaeum sp. AArc-CO]
MTDEIAGDSGERDDSSSAPTVFDLSPDCTLEDVSEGSYYHAVVNGVVDYGVFVDVSDVVSGLIHESNLEERYAVGDRLIVELEEVRENGDVAFDVVHPDDYRTEAVEHEPEITDVGTLSPGAEVTIEGLVVQIKQTDGPTIFHVNDGTGIVPCAAFEEAGVRASPEISLEDPVRIAGSVENHQGSRQVEVDDLSGLADERARTVAETVEERIDERAEPIDVEPLVEWGAFEPIREDLRELARLLRRTVLEGRPIRVRHHADGDGMCAAIPVQYALEELIRTVHGDPDAPRHLFKRLPSKAPFYEMEDVTRDLNFALEGRARHGQKLPLLLMLDNGSTEEDVPAYENLAHYDIPIAVVDHHHPDPDAVEPLLDAHVNPYLHGEDYRITTGMMCVELARMLAADLGDELEHVPAIAGISDRSQAEVMDEYIALAGEAGYDRDDLVDISEALDYAAHLLRYSDGETLVNDALNVGCDDDERHRELVAFLASRSRRDVDKQLAALEPHVEHERLASGAHLYRVDLDNFAHRFTYPAPGKTTGNLHDRKVTETGEPVITIGYGPDFAVLRSDGVRLDIPQMVTELNEELPGSGVSGGGHLVVGSIKFVKGRRSEVIDALVEKMADAELDEALSSAATPE